MCASADYLVEYFINYGINIRRYEYLMYIIAVSRFRSTTVYNVCLIQRDRFAACNFRSWSGTAHVRAIFRRGSRGHYVKFVQPLSISRKSESRTDAQNE